MENMSCCDCVFFDDPQFCPYCEQNPENANYTHIPLKEQRL